MATGKKSFVLYTDYDTIFEQLTDAEAGQLIKHLFRYVSDKEPEIENRMLRILFEPIKQQLKRDLKKWDKVLKKKSDGGKKGMESKWGKSKDGNKVLRHERLAAARAKARHTNEEWNELLEICGNVCVKCGGDSDLVKDHIIPIYQGGSDGIGNLQPLCKSCNSRKGPDNTNYIKLPNKCLTDAYHLLTSLTVNDTVTVTVNVNERENTGALANSNLFRKPIIPTKQQVFEAIVTAGGDKVMAKSFYEKHEGTGWFLNGSPIVNYKALASRFVSNWKENEQGKPKDENFNPNGHIKKL